MSTVLSYTPQQVQRQVTRRCIYDFIGEFIHRVRMLNIIMYELRDSKFTGKLEIDFSQGNILSANSTDSQKI